MAQRIATLEAAKAKISEGVLPRIAFGRGWNRVVVFPKSGKRGATEAPAQHGCRHAPHQEWQPQSGFGLLPRLCCSLVAVGTEFRQPESLVEACHGVSISFQH